MVILTIFVLPIYEPWGGTEGEGEGEADSPLSRELNAGLHPRS